MAKSNNQVKQPQPAQIQAIRRLLDERDLDQARRRIGPLLKAYPAHRPLLALAWQVEQDAGAFTTAAARAYDWTLLSPASAAAQAALAESAFAAGLPALGAHGAIALARLEGEPVPVVPEMDTPFGIMTADEALRVDLSRLLLGQQRYAQAAALLDGGRHPSLLNNRGLALFASGDVAPALAQFEASWQQEARNTFALERLLRLRLWRDGGQAGASLAPALLKAAALRAEDALAKLNGLVLLGLDDAAEATWQAAMHKSARPMFDEGRLLLARFAYGGAVLALRAGRLEQAEDRLALALQNGHDYDAAHDLDDALAERPAAPCFIEIGESGAWFPSTWLKRLSQLHRTADADLDQQMTPLFDECDASADYLGLAAQLGGEAGHRIGVEILKQRAVGGDAAALDQLRSLLTRPCGPDGLRSGLLNWLYAERLIAGDVATPLLSGGVVRSVVGQRFRLVREPVRASSYSPALQQRQRALMDALARQDHAQALQIGRELVRRAPEVAMSHANLAMVLEFCGGHEAEVEALFQQALALDDGYVFARAGLARVATRRGDGATAEALLAPLLGREEYHVSEWRTILLAQREIALALGNADALAPIAAALMELEDGLLR